MRRVLVALVILGLVFAAWAVGTGWNPLSPSVETSIPSISEPADPAGTVDGTPAEAQPATVEYVHDGDTLFLTDGRKVRLLGINTPEIGENAECWGDQATSELRGLVDAGTNVWVQQDVEALDQYGRSLLFVFLEDGTNVNVEMVRVGAAEIEQYDPNWLYSDQLHAAEDAAYADNIGLWGNC